MADKDRRSQLVHTSLAVGFAVFFYACGRPPAETAGTPGPDSPDKQAPVTASIAPVAVPAIESPARTTPLAGGGAATFGSAEPPPEPTADQNSLDGAPASASATPAPGQRGPGQVITNADLARYSHLKKEFGMKDGVVMVDSTRLGAKKAEKEAQGTENPALAPEEIDRETRATQLQMAALTTDIESLQKRIPSLHNPLLPRVAPLDADALAEAGMDNVERLARVNQRIAENQQQIGALRTRLLELHAMSQASKPAAVGDNPDSHLP